MVIIILDYRAHQTDLVKKSCASNSFLSMGVIINLQKGKLCSSSLIARKEKLAASIIFWASESGAKSEFKQPSRVLSPTTPTADKKSNTQ